MKDRILISNISCWDNRGADTLTNLFSGYGADDIANIYFKAGIPSSDVCNNYFYISENNVIKSIFCRKLKTGKIVMKGNPADTDIGDDKTIEEKRFSFWSRHKLWSVFSLRELLWILGKWNTKELNQFVDNFAPTKLFVPIEGYGYFNRVTVYLMRRLGIPTYSFMWDDNFTYKQYPFNLFYRIHRYFLRKNVRNIIKGSEKVFVISPKMKTELDSEYGIESVLLTKGAVSEQAKTHFERPYKMIYAGKLNLGRYETVLKIVKSINSHYDSDYYFDIYSQTYLSEREKAALNTRSSHFCGSVMKTELDKIIDNYDIIVIAEALSGKEKAVARLSFSTKTTDSLASGKCVLCVCPKDNATYEYLKDNDAAYCASNGAEILGFLHQVSKEKDVLKRFSINAAKLVKQNHNMDSIRRLMYEAMRIEE